MIIRYRYRDLTKDWQKHTYSEKIYIYIYIYICVYRSIVKYIGVYNSINRERCRYLYIYIYIYKCTDKDPRIVILVSLIINDIRDALFPIIV